MQPDVTNFQEFMSQACKHGVKNTYCFEVWNGLLDPHGPTGVIVQQNYTVSLINSSNTRFVVGGNQVKDLSA